ncbi:MULTISPECIES: helix-turn-helix domain-containing protein [Lysinibacillus]|uniref:helix-turn-helix domain-containing protein n=1 Tax=Lysinibacillus TaxID=400634 RepID=UPI0027A9C800|nr:helix-turn-helix domain-containing protein [Lysinibacillus boronitolerans]
MLAEFEHDFIQQQTKAGLEVVRKRGRLGGRPVIDADTKHRIIKLFESGESATNIAKEYGIGRSTVYKVLKEKVI